MIGVDTNVLVRLFLENDELQHQAALRFFDQRSRNDPAYVSLVVVVEFVWILRRRYDYSMDSVRQALSALLDSPDIRLQDRHLVTEAVVQSAEPKVDLIDVLIAGLARQNGCATTMTFDREAAKRIPGMDLIA